MTDRELMQMLLDVLENISMGGDPRWANDVLPALHARLAQPEPEPVACDCDSPTWCKQYKKCHRAMLGFEPYVAPPQREWQRLTDDEINTAAYNNHPLDGIRAFARAVESKLKEKNT
jgi:hypothetical protein